jgi:hypothetical protein
MKLRFVRNFAARKKTPHDPYSTAGTACRYGQPSRCESSTGTMVGFQIRVGRQMPTSSAELPAERTAASRCWLEPPGWVPSRRLAQSSVPRHGGSQVETQAQNSVRHQECFEWLGSLIVRTSRAYLETTTVFSSKNPSQWFAPLGSA